MLWSRTRVEHGDSIKLVRYHISGTNRQMSLENSLKYLFKFLYLPLEGINSIGILKIHFCRKFSSLGWEKILACYYYNDLFDPTSFIIGIKIKVDNEGEFFL